MLFAGTVALPVSDVDVSGFDYGSYLYRKGISGTSMAFWGNWKNLGRRKTLGVKQWALLCREWIVNQFRGWQLGADEFAVVAALTVGEKRVLTPSLKDIYSGAGVSHVLALSGLHIGILSALLCFLLTPLKRLKYGEFLRSLVVVTALWGFAFVSGLSPSVVRAVVMVSLYFLATCVSEERYPAIYALVLAAFLMLVYQPLYLFDLSCQLSFLAVASILYFYPIVSQCFGSKYRLLNWLWNGISVSVSAQAGTLPLILYYFGSFPTYFLVANLIVSVLAGCVLCCAIVALLTVSVPFVGELSVGCLDRVTWALNTSIRGIRQLDGSQLDALSISVLQAVCGFFFIYGLHRFLVYRKPVHVLCILLALNVSLGEWVYRSFEPVSTSLCYSRTKLYLKQNRHVMSLASSNGLYTVDSLTVGVLNSDAWSKKEATPKIALDYLFLSRGFKGSVKSLLRVFTIRLLVFDSSLSIRYRNFLKKECEEMNIPYTDVSEKGSYRIFL